MAEFDRVLLVKQEVFVYRIAPRASNRGYRAAEWQLDKPDWTGRLRLVTRAENLFIKLEDRNSGELFAVCPVDAHPGAAVEQVLDSSRYFVLRLQDDAGRNAFVGLGFGDRSDSFDLNVALQEHFKQLRHEADAERSLQELASGPKLDLGFKEGQTIRIQLNTKKGGDSAKKSPASGVQPTGGASTNPFINDTNSPHWNTDGDTAN